MIHDGLWCAFENWHMGEAAEHIASKCGVTRAEQDRFAVQSHQRAAAAWEAGAFDAEVVPVTVGSGAKAKTVTPRRGHPARHDRRGAGEAASRRSGADGTVTAGNASTLSDGAAAVVVGSARAGRAAGGEAAGPQSSPTPPAASRRRTSSSPRSPAVRQVLEKAELTLEDIDLFELNEAFAAQMLACGKELGLDEAQVNVHGGAIALGHPIGRIGARACW